LNLIPSGQERILALQHHVHCPTPVVRLHADSVNDKRKSFLSSDDDLQLAVTIDVDMCRLVIDCVIEKRSPCWKWIVGTA